jgi:hypothetical protein
MKSAARPPGSFTAAMKKEVSVNIIVPTQEDSDAWGDFLTRTGREMNETSLRIQKLIQNNPQMTNTQIAKKIGRSGPFAEERVEKERKGGRCQCGGVRGTHSYCRPRKGDPS